MSIKMWLATATNDFKAVGIATARLDCLVLLEDVLDTDRTQLLAHDDRKLTSEQLKLLNVMVKRRIAHEPLAYIRGKSEFYGREFMVNNHTLEPRPETETLVDLLKEAVKNDKYSIKSIIDVGTGSGCIAITAKLELPALSVIATDIDGECIKIAKQNSANLGSDVDFYQGNLLELLPSNIPGPYIVACNLPYVPDNFHINEAAGHEPKHAIFGGTDGLDLYRNLFTQIETLKCHPEYVICESMPPQHETLQTIANGHDYKLAKTDDFIQVFKLLTE